MHVHENKSDRYDRLCQWKRQKL